jgi:uncharacterized damage-inducible protein DinB
MSELRRFEKLIKDHFDGHPWIDVSLMDTLSDISAEEASTKVGNLNTIWQIVLHITEWKRSIIARLSGILSPAPAHNHIYAVEFCSDEAWDEAIEDLSDAHHELLKMLTIFDVEKFDHIYAPNGLSYYEHLNGALQHDVYHLGQIVILKRMVREG